MKAVQLYLLALILEFHLFLYLLATRVLLVRCGGSIQRRGRSFGRTGAGVGHDGEPTGGEEDVKGDEAQVFGDGGRVRGSGDAVVAGAALLLDLDDANAGAVAAKAAVLARPAVA